eukprot:g10676.t1
MSRGGWRWSAGRLLILFLLVARWIRRSRGVPVVATFLRAQVRGCRLFVDRVRAALGPWPPKTESVIAKGPYFLFLLLALTVGTYVRGLGLAGADETSDDYLRHEREERRKSCREMVRFCVRKHKVLERAVGGRSVREAWEKLKCPRLLDHWLYSTEVHREDTEETVTESGATSVPLSSRNASKEQLPPEDVDLRPALRLQKPEQGLPPRAAAAASHGTVSQASLLSEELLGDAALPMTAEEAFRSVEALGKCAPQDLFVVTGAVVVACLLRLELTGILARVEKLDRPRSREAREDDTRVPEQVDESLYSELKRKISECEEMQTELFENGKFTRHHREMHRVASTILAPVLADAAGRAREFYGTRLRVVYHLLTEHLLFRRDGDVACIKGSHDVHLPRSISFRRLDYQKLLYIFLSSFFSLVSGALDTTRYYYQAEILNLAKDLFWSVNLARAEGRDHVDRRPLGSAHQSGAAAGAPVVGSSIVESANPTSSTAAPLSSRRDKSEDVAFLSPVRAVLQLKKQQLRNTVCSMLIVEITGILASLLRDQFSSLGKQELIRTLKVRLFEALCLEAVGRTLSSLSILWRKNRQLSLFVFTMMPLKLLVSLRLQRWQEYLETVYVAADLRGKITEVWKALCQPSAFLTIRMFGREPEEVRNFGNFLRVLDRDENQRLMLYKLFAPIEPFLANFIEMLVLWYGGRLIIESQDAQYHHEESNFLSISSTGAAVGEGSSAGALLPDADALGFGDLSTFLLMANNAFDSARFLRLRAQGIGDEILEPAEKIMALLRAQPKIGLYHAAAAVEKEGGGREPLPGGGHDDQEQQLALVFDCVSFRYPSRPAVRVLRGVSFRVDAGDHLGVLVKGRTNPFPETCLKECDTCSGKSSLFLLMLRIYEPDSGRILLNGVDLREYEPLWLRREVFSVVTQDVVLLERSIKDNVMYGANPATTTT